MQSECSADSVQVTVWDPERRTQSTLALETSRNPLQGLENCLMDAQTAAGLGTAQA